MRTTHLRPAAGLTFYVLFSGCAVQNVQHTLPSSEQQLLAECRTSLTAKACSDSPDEASRNLCFEQGATAYAQRPTQKSRRRWLLANGCPAAIINSGATGIAAVTAVPKAPTVVKPTITTVPVFVVQTAPILQPEQPKIDALPVNPIEAADGVVVQASLVNDSLETTSISTTAATPLPDTLTLAPQLNRGARAKAQLREAIVAHQPEMKNCVDRQLKLVPTLMAEGTLVVDVDAHGQVPRVKLKGKDLSGTALELCLRTAAARWRFPRTGRSYSIEAPLVVTGRQDPS